MRQKVILLLFISLLKVNFGFATHTMGGELTYSCIGNNTYNLTYSFYRDCSGINAPSGVLIQIQSSCYPTFSVTLNPTPLSPIEISPACSGVLSSCNGGTFTGIQRWIYSGTVTLPGPCSNWTFSRTECCRNPSITTIGSPSVTNMYIFSTLNVIGGVCNNSPTFVNNPVFFACIGQRFCFNPGAIDPDGDSLAYQLIPPRSSTGIINYNLGYSAAQFIHSNPPITFNPLTGDVCMTPTQADISIFAMLISEYRNGVLIGQVERDIQIQVTVCNNIIPFLSGINGTPSFTINTCLGIPCTFWVRSVDPNPSDTTRITWNNGITNATLTTFGGRRDSALFSWIPTSSGQFCFTITVTDNSCPYIGIQTYSYCVNVSNPQVNAGNNRMVNCGECIQLTAVGSDGITPYTYIWNDTIFNRTLNQACPGLHIVEITDANGCKDYDTVNVFIDSTTLIQSLFIAELGCEDIPATFTNLSTGNGINSYRWTFGDGTYSYVQNPPAHIYSDPGTYVIQLVITNSEGCMDSMMSATIIRPKPPLTLNDTAICFGDIVEIIPNTTANNFIWRPGNDTTSFIYSSPSLPTTYYLTVTDNYGCINSDSAFVDVYSLPEANFILDTAYYDSEDILIQDSSYSQNGNIIAWLWNINGTFIVDQNPTCVFFDTGYYNINLLITDEKQCVDTITKRIKIIEDPFTTVYIPNAFTPNQDDKNDLFKIYGNNITNVKVDIFDRWGLLIYQWEGVNGYWDGGNSQNDTYVYKVYVEGLKGFKKSYIGKVTLVK